jgi:hypothetical protein
MHHLPPPEDFAVIHCRGRCKKFCAIPLDELSEKVEEYGHNSLDSFREAYVCSECESRFIVLIENAFRTNSCP